MTRIRTQTRALAAAIVVVNAAVLSAQAPPSAVEDIVIARSWRESRIAPTAFCTRTTVGFANARSEDRYTFRAVATQTSDGRIVDTNAGTIGDLHACFGSTADSARTDFYAEGHLGAIAFVGRGECVTTRREFPESGLAVIHCYLDLSNLPDGYVGGQLTTNTMNSRAVLGGVSDPAGYTQPSIATVRLWRRR